MIFVFCQLAVSWRDLGVLNLAGLSTVAQRVRVFTQTGLLNHYAELAA